MTPRIKDLILKSGVVQYESDDKMQDAERLVILVIEECLLALEPNLYSKEIDYEFEQLFYIRCNKKITQCFEIK